MGLHVSDPFIGLIVENNGKKAGAVILNDYTPGQNIELTVHVSGNWTASDVRGIARYCFERVRRITARTSVNNSRAIRMLEVLGFRREGVMRDWFAESDAILFGLLRSEQRIFR